MTISVNGQQVEAYNLLMKKEFAQVILNGQKKVEFRSFSDHYCRMFIDEEVARKNKEAGLKPGDEKFDFGLRDTQYIHFHNYNNSWYLDVEVAGIGMCVVDSYDISSLAEDFDDFKAYIDDAKKNDELPEDERPMMFYLVLGDVVSTNL